MELKEMISLVRKGWILLVACALLAVAAGAAYVLLAERKYTATTSLFVSVKTVTADSAGEIVQGSSAAQLKVKSYVEVVRSASVLGPVIEDLKLDTSVQELARRIGTEAPQNTVLIKVSVTDTDPSRAAQIANTIGTHTGSAVDALEKPEAGESPVSIQTIQPATVPTQPSSPRLVQTLVLSLAMGVLGGFALLVLRDKLDTRVHGQSDVEALTDIPVIGSIGFDPAVEDRPLVVRDDPRSPRAEAFRALRTNLQFLDPTNPQRSFVITSSLPSEGKTTTTANLAVAIAESGASVALIDADLRRPRLGEILGIEGAAGLTDVLVGRAELDDLLQPWGTHNLMVLPAGTVPPNPSELLGSAGMQALIDELSMRYQYVIIDAPPLLPVTDAAVLSRFTRGTVLVASVTRVRRAHIRQALSSLEQVERSPLGIVLSMLPATGPNAYGYGAYDRYYGSDADVATPELRRGRRRVPAPEGPVAATPTR